MAAGGVGETCGGCSALDHAEGDRRYQDIFVFLV
jgi:hypothetical protein